MPAAFGASHLRACPTRISCNVCHDSRAALSSSRGPIVDVRPQTLRRLAGWKLFPNTCSPTLTRVSLHSARSLETLPLPMSPAADALLACPLPIFTFFASLSAFLPGLRTLFSGPRGVVSTALFAMGLSGAAIAFLTLKHPDLFLMSPRKCGKRSGVT